MDGAQNSFKRHVRIVQLWDCHPTTKRSLLLPMFDPVILKTVEGGFLLSGIEIESRGTDVAEHVQLWLCMPAVEGR